MEANGDKCSYISWQRQLFNNLRTSFYVWELDGNKKLYHLEIWDGLPKPLQEYPRSHKEWEVTKHEPCACRLYWPPAPLDRLTRHSYVMIMAILSNHLQGKVVKTTFYLISWNLNCAKVGNMNKKVIGNIIGHNMVNICYESQRVHMTFYKLAYPCCSWCCIRQHSHKRYILHGLKKIDDKSEFN